MDDVEGISLRQVFEYALSRKNEAEQTNSTEVNQIHEFFRGKNIFISKMIFSFKRCRISP